MPKCTMCKENIYFRISLQNKNESCSVNSFNVHSLTISANIFARLYVEVTIAGKIGQKGGLNFWYSLEPYTIPGLLTQVSKSFWSSFER